MSKEILIATSNPHKRDRLAHYLDSLGVSVVSFADVGKNIDIVEDGKTPEENALKKAIAGFKAIQMPTLGVDYWFYIEGISEGMQPGPFVRRIFIGSEGARKEATDQEMLDYYTGVIRDLGGRTSGLWTSGVALVVAEDKTYTETFTRKTILTSKMSPRRTEGEPLNSIQIDLGTGKYFTDLTAKEWLKLQAERERGFIRFIESHLDEI